MIIDVIVFSLLNHKPEAFSDHSSRFRVDLSERGTTLRHGLLIGLPIFFNTKNSIVEPNTCKKIVDGQKSKKNKRLENII